MKSRRTRQIFTFAILAILGLMLLPLLAGMVLHPGHTLLGMAAFGAPRAFVDENLKQSVALPNAANTANTNSIDLGAATSFPVTDKFQVKLSTTAGTGANNKNLTIVLQASNEAAANFANIGALATLVIPEVAASYAATERVVALPPDLNKRYIRASVTGEANGGNAANGALTVQLLF